MGIKIVFNFAMLKAYLFYNLLSEKRILDTIIKELLKYF